MLWWILWPNIKWFRRLADGDLLEYQAIHQYQHHNVNINVTINITMAIPIGIHLHMCIYIPGVVLQHHIYIYIYVVAPNASRLHARDASQTFLRWVASSYPRGEGRFFGPWGISMATLVGKMMIIHWVLGFDLFSDKPLSFVFLEYNLKMSCFLSEEDWNAFRDKLQLLQYPFWLRGLTKECEYTL